jgi:hypothetical protein
MVGHLDRFGKLTIKIGEGDDALAIVWQRQ